MDKQANITTNNPDWGFFGTTLRNLDCSEEQAGLDYGEAGRELVRALKISPRDAITFLDSRMGRHFADARFPLESPAELVRRIAADKRWGLRDHVAAAVTAKAEELESMGS